MTQPAPPRQLGIYLHWPYCAVICPYCDFNVYRARSIDPEPLVAAMEADLSHWRAITGPRPVTSLFFGGGTPSLLPPAMVARLIETCDQLWGLEAGAEISLEANPTDAEASRFAGLASAGVNRLSLGIQALDDDALRFLGRNHGAVEARAAASVARAAFDQLSIDLIYARPNQSLQDWAGELEAALQLGPDHLSPYQLTIEPGTAFDRAVTRGTLKPQPAERAADFYLLTQDVLAAGGLLAYEVSNHARGVEARSRHNLIYWTSQDWIGVGPGAHGRLTVDAGRIATTCARKPGEYLAAIKASGTGTTGQEALTASEARDEFWLMGLRLVDGVDAAAAPGEALDPEAVSRMQADGLMVVDDGRIRLTPTGLLLADRVCAELLG